MLTGLFLLMAVVTTLILRPAQPQTLPVQLTPAEAAITGPVSITMSCDTANAEIRYTTDGTEPNPQSSLYQKTPVQVRPGVTLWARAFRRGYKPSDETRVIYHLPTETEPAEPNLPAALSRPVSPAGARGVGAGGAIRSLACCDP